MKEEVKRVPVLRFPEFEEDWEIHKLGDLIASMESGISVNSEDYPAPDNGVYGVLKTSCISSGSFTPKENKQVVPDDISRVKLNPTRDSIIVSRMNTPQLVGESGYVYDDFPNLFLPDRLWLIKTQKDVNAKWLSLVLISSKVKVALTNIATGTSGSMKNIAQPNFLKITTLKPSLPEQQKIASFLTAVDDNIQQLNKKKALLEQYKKGVMQQLFSRTLRFKDEEGNEYPEWEEKQLNQLAERITTKNKVGNSNVLTISAQQGLISQLDYFNNSVAARDLSGYYLLSKNDFAYNKSYSAGYPMGAIKRLNKYDNGVVSTLYICFRMNDKLDNTFAEQLFESGIHNKEIEKVAQEGARNHGLLNIGVADFFNISFTIPCKCEQTKIANFLSAIDEKITGVDQQIEYTKQFKKGLLQQMFV